MPSSQSGSIGGDGSITPTSQLFVSLSRNCGTCGHPAQIAALGPSSGTPWDSLGPTSFNTLADRERRALPNKRLKLAGADRFKEADCCAPGGPRTFVQR